MTKDKNHPKLTKTNTGHLNIYVYFLNQTQYSLSSRFQNAWNENLEVQIFNRKKKEKKKTEIAGTTKWNKIP